MTTDRPTVHFFQLFAHHISTVGVSTMLSTPRCHHRCHPHASGGCQRIRVLLLDLVLLRLLPTIGAFRGPMSATKNNIFERRASAGAESMASASESSSSLDLRDHHRFYIIRHGETDANAADGGCLGWAVILMLWIPSISTSFDSIFIFDHC